MKSIKEVLIERDGMDPDEADDLIAECRLDLQGRIQDDDPSSIDICAEYFGLEPDYLDELI